MKKRIICFGDSNTWGYNPVDGSRYDENTRWPMVLERLLGDDYQIIEEAQNGRTIANPDPWEWGCKCGLDYVVPMVESHVPFDMLIIMLGSNDLKKKFSLPAADIAGSLQNMLMKTKSFLQYKCNADPKILIVSPPHLGEGVADSIFGEFFGGKETVENSKRMAFWYKQVADQFGCEFFDASTVCKAGDVDHLHIMPEGHKALAEGIYNLIKDY